MKISISLSLVVFLVLIGVFCPAEEKKDVKVKGEKERFMAVPPDITGVWEVGQVWRDGELQSLEQTGYDQVEFTKEEVKFYLKGELVKKGKVEYEPNSIPPALTWSFGEEEIVQAIYGADSFELRINYREGESVKRPESFPEEWGRKKNEEYVRVHLYLINKKKS